MCAYTVCVFALPRVNTFVRVLTWCLFRNAARLQIPTAPRREKGGRGGEGKG